MMSIDLSKQSPLPPPVPAKAPRRPTPCAGLFGWRKGDPANPCEANGDKAPGRDYPAAWRPS